MDSYKSDIKSQVHQKFQEWRDLLSLKELELVQEIDQSFHQFEVFFENEKLVDQDAQNEGIKWLNQVEGIINTHSSKIEIDSEYIAFEILDSSSINDLSVESLYS